MVNFFDSVSNFITIIGNFLISIVDNLERALDFLYNSINAYVHCFDYVPHFVYISGLIVLSYSVIKFVLGR